MEYRNVFTTLDGCRTVENTHDGVPLRIINRPLRDELAGAITMRELPLNSDIIVKCRVYQLAKITRNQEQVLNEYREVPEGKVITHKPSSWTLRGYAVHHPWGIVPHSFREQDDEHLKFWEKTYKEDAAHFRFDPKDVRRAKVVISVQELLPENQISTPAKVSLNEKEKA